MDTNKEDRKDTQTPENDNEPTFSQVEDFTEKAKKANDANTAADRTAEKKKKSKKKKVVIIVILAVAVLAAVILAAACFVVNHYINLIGRTDDSAVDTIPPEDEMFEFEGFETLPDDFDENDLPDNVYLLKPEDIEWSDIEALNDDELINILLIGNDYRDGYYTRRSDSIILCSINPSLGRIVITSLMRDMYVQIPGYSDNIMNAAFRLGGIPLLKETITKNFGISIDGCVEVGLEQFMNVIDTVGGVDIYITEKEASAIGAASSGYVHLNGQLAKKYAALRLIDNDFQRTERQRKILHAIYSKTKELSLTQYLDLANDVLPSLITDMSNTEMLRMLIKCYPLISATDLEQYRLPPDGAYQRAVIRGLFVLVPDLDKCREALMTYLMID